MFGNGAYPIHKHDGNCVFLLCVIGYTVLNLRINNPLRKLHLSNNSQYVSLLL